MHAFEDAEKGVGKGGVAADFGGEGGKVGFVCAGKEFVESFGSESERQDDGADRRCRRITTADVIINIERVEVFVRLRQR